MVEVPQIQKFTAYHWPHLLKRLTSKDKPPIKLSILETIAFDPTSSRVDIWAYTDSLGFLRRQDRKILLKTDVTAVCLRAILSPAELKLYESEVTNFTMTDSMPPTNYPFSNRKACFILFADGRRRLLHLNAFLRLIHTPEKLVTGQVTGIQIYTHTKDAQDHIYIVSVHALTDGQYELQLFKVRFNGKFPDHIVAQEQMSGGVLEMRLVRMSKEVLRLLEERLKTCVREMQLLFVVDGNNGLRLIGTHQAVLRDANISSLTDPRSRINNFSMPPSHSDMDQTRSHSSSFLASRGRKELFPPRPVSTIIRPQFRPKPKLPTLSKPTQLSSQLRISPSHPVPKSKDITFDTSPENPVKELLMVDQEAQASYWESQDSFDLNSGSPGWKATETRKKSMNSVSMVRLESYTLEGQSRTSPVRLGNGRLSSQLSRAVNSTIALPEPDSSPRFGVIRTGNLRDPKKDQRRGKGLRLLNKSFLRYG